MTRLINQIALDANIEHMDERQSVIAELTHCNPTDQRLINDGKYGKGIRFRAEDQKFSDEIFLAQDNNEANRFLATMAMDVDTVGYGVPSSGVLPNFTTVYTNKIIEQLFQTTPFRQLTTDFQQGMFGTTNIKIPTLQASGTSVLYSDMSGEGDSSINVNWMDRQVVTLQRPLTYGDLAVAQMAMAKIDYVGKLREFVAKLINIDMNNIGFSGYAGMRVYGLLNDPSLNPTIVAPNGASGSSLWVNKTYLEISADIRALFASVVSIAGGQASLTDPVMFGIPPAVYVALTTQNALGTQSVLEYIKETFPNLEIAQVQNYQGTGTPIGSSTPNKCQMIWKTMGGQEVALNAFASPYNSHGVVRQISSYNEKISYALAGCFVAQAIGIATMSNI